jgi:cell division septal protein FtsQ
MAELTLIYSRSRTPRKHPKPKSEKYYLRKAAREMVKYFLIFLLFIMLYIVLLILLSAFNVL